MKAVVGRLAMAVAVFGAMSLASSGAESESGDRSAAMAVFSAQHPQAGFVEVAGRTTRVYGEALSRGLSPEDTAERFRRLHSGVFGVGMDDLDPRGPLADERHTQPVMFDAATGSYKFTLVYYTQWKSGIPVFRADLRLLVRNERGYPLVLASNGLRDLGGFVPLANGVRDSSKGVATAKETVLALTQFTAPELVIWAGVDDMVVAPTVAYRFVGDNGVRVNGDAEKWLFVADAATGQILYQENQLLSVDVAGNVTGMASTGPGTDVCEPELPTTMPYARVNIGATQVFADISGDYVIPNAGSGQVTVDSPIRGQRFVVNNLGGTSTVLSTLAVPPGPANFLHNSANTSEFNRAEVNAYVQANIARDFTLTYNPSYPVIAGQTEFSITVNEAPTGFCPGNAQYQGDNLRFCAASGSTPNTAWSSVVQHEFGHHVVSVGGSGQGAYGEGFGDVLSVLILDDPRLGLGFFGSCSGSLRNADNSCQFSAGSCSTCGSEIHDCGQLLSGCVWDTRNQLAITNPGTYIDILSNLAINSVLMHSGSSIAADITVDFLVLDDDDGNINNGTPHHNEICTGFGAHGLDCPVIDPIGFTYPNGRPDFALPNVTTDVRVDAVSLGGTPIAGSGTVSHRIGNSGTFTTVSMSEIVANQYIATLPGANCGEDIQYYFSAVAVGGATFTDPPGAPASTFSTISATGTVTILSHDFETNPGWTVSGNATDGQWDRGIPVICSRGDPATDFDGSGRCWLTDNSAANSCNSDVDGGTTTLMSEAINLSGLVAPRVSYARWYSNTAGASPEADVFDVEISGNNGGSWVSLETVGPTGSEVDGGWFVKEFDVSQFVTPGSQTRVRFHASDLGSGSVVEAGVDAFRIWDVVCEPCEDPCDDGNPCTINDVCTGPNSCEGTPVDCSGDGDQCNVASCDLGGGVGNCDTLTPMSNGTVCDDSDACIVGETCQAGTCAGGNPPNCSGLGDQCNVASCDAGGSDGNCDVVTPVGNGTGCEDGDPCTVDDICQSGTCGSGGAPDCSSSGDACNSASCNPGGATGNCDVLSPLPDGISCGVSLICASGECVPDPGNTRVFMTRPGMEASAASSGPTTINMTQGGAVTMEVWLSDTEGQLLGNYQISLAGAATPEAGATGTVVYVDNADPLGCDSLLVDVTDPDWVFFSDQPAPFCSETGLPGGIAFATNLPIGNGHAITLGYLGEFQFAASGDALGTFTLDFIPIGLPPNGGSVLGDESGLDPVYATLQPVNIVVTESIPCVTAADCADQNTDGITDDVCVWWECNAGTCDDIAKIHPSDMGMPLGECPIDDFCNLADALHALTCFAGTNTCDVINIDAGSALGGCTPDGFCNLADALHALTCFAGTNTCSCGPAPEAQHEPNVVGEVTLFSVADDRAVAPGDEVRVRVFMTQQSPPDREQEAVRDSVLVSAYQLHTSVSGGRSGSLELMGIEIEDHKNFVFGDSNDTFDAFNVETGQMLAGLYGGHVEMSGGAYLATFTYRVQGDAAGTFVVDVLHNEANQTMLIGAEQTDKIEVARTAPAVVVVTTGSAGSIR